MTTRTVDTHGASEQADARLGADRGDPELQAPLSASEVDSGLALAALSQRNPLPSSAGPLLQRSILSLQATHGNQFVQRQLKVQRQDADEGVEAGNPAAEIIAAMWDSAIVAPLTNAANQLPGDPKAAFTTLAPAFATLNSIGGQVKSSMPEIYSQYRAAQFSLESVNLSLATIAGAQPISPELLKEALTERIVSVAAVGDAISAEASSVSGTAYGEGASEPYRPYESPGG